MNHVARIILSVCFLALSGFAIAQAEAPSDSKPIEAADVISKDSQDSSKKLNAPVALDSTISSTEVTTTSWPLVILTLMGVIGFIFALAWVAKRFGGMSAMGMREMKVISAMPVGSRERVALIDVKGQQFLIGITSQNINHLHTFDEPVVQSSEPTASEFASKLSQILKTNKEEKHEDH